MIWRPTLVVPFSDNGFKEFLQSANASNRTSHLFSVMSEMANSDFEDMKNDAQNVASEYKKNKIKGHGVAFNEVATSGIAELRGTADALKASDVSCMFTYIVVHNTSGFVYLRVNCVVPA